MKNYNPLFSFYSPLLQLQLHVLEMSRRISESVSSAIREHKRAELPAPIAKALPEDDKGEITRLIKCIIQHKPLVSKPTQIKTMEGLPTPKPFPVKLYQR